MLDKYTHTSKDNWIWERARLEDADEIGELAYDHYATEISEFFAPSAECMSYNISKDIVDQKYNILKSFVIVARHRETGKILAYSWCVRDYAPWSNEEMLSIKMAHVLQSLSVRDRITLCAQMIQQWELFCRIAGVPVICSTTMRGSQDTFLKLHTQAGYTVRGSFAYKRVIQA